MLNVTAATLIATTPVPGTLPQRFDLDAVAARSVAQPPHVSTGSVRQHVPEPRSLGEAPRTVDTPSSSAPVQTIPDDQSQDVLVTGRRRAAGDPLQAVNAKSFAATQAVDHALVGPAAMAYQRSIPQPVRSGIHNFLYNLREPVVFVNFVVQLKPGEAAETAGRFAVNSTVGVGGVLDVARRRPFRLPRRANGFADTLGYYGVRNGPFLYLPITGPTTVRDLIGGTLDRLLLPLAVGKPFANTAFTAPLGVLGALDHRADFDPTIRKLRDGVADPYASSRKFYLSRKQAENDRLHGRGPGNAGPMGEAPVGSVPPIRPSVTPDPTPAGAPGERS